MKNKVLFILFLIALQFSFAQRILDLHYDYNQHAFEYNIYNYSYSNQEPLKHYADIIYRTKLNQPIPVGDYTLIANAAFPINTINDSNFIYHEHLLDWDTIYCSNDSVNICNVLTRFDFNYAQHIINPAQNKIYRLVNLFKTDWTLMPPIIYKEYYVLKSAQYNVASLNQPDLPFDSIESYYKFQSNDQLSSLYQNNENSIFIIRTAQAIANNINTISFHIMELDSNLNFVQNRIIQHTLDSSLVDPNPFSFKKDKDNNCFFTIPNHIWKHDANLAAIDSFSFANDLDVDQYFRSQQHYHIYTNQQNNIIHLIDNNNDTIRTCTIPNNSNHKVLVTKDSSFVILNMEVIPMIAITPAIYIWDKFGNFKTRMLVYDITHTYDWWLNNFDIKYDIDTLDNISYGVEQENSGGSQGFYQYNINYLNLKWFTNCSGKIIVDNNRNCFHDSLEIGAKNILVELQLNSKRYFTLSNDSGYYNFIPFDTGHGKVILHLENQTTYTNACQDTFDVYISDTSQNPEINFLIQTPSCSHPTPKLNVEISTPFLRRCFDNNYTLSVFNESSDTAFNSYVDIELDAHLIATDTAFLSTQNLGNNTYRFYLGNVSPLQTIHKQLKVKVDCDSTILGQTHCVKATAFPYEFCNIIDAKYMQAHAACRNDSVIFTIKNIGYPENFQQYFRIIENDTITYNGILSFTQSISQNSLAYYNPTGKTYRLETRQYPMYVNEDTILSVSIEGCGNSDFSKGYVNLFSQDDDAPNVDIDCHQNVGSYDPNEKTAQPSGYGDSSYILPNTPLEYTIHFQNKGTYAASYVTIIDTLSSLFDITTFQMVSSSHPFTYSIIDSNFLQFSSTSINLPAEQDDTLSSNGYIKFKISPKKNIPTATTIKNTASIIFDFNTPIITNTVIRNVNDDFLKVKIISSVKNNLSKIKTTIYPNPFTQTATLSFDYNQPTQLTIFSMDGKIMQQYQSTDNFYTIDRKQLSNGMYLYELKKISNNELLDTGKLVIQ